ncbi:MAG: tetratricopeptide repeat protein, partial [Nitrospinota bacterium]
APPPTRAPEAPPVAAPSPPGTKRPPARPETSPRTPEGWIARARAFEREGQWARAQAAYERALGAGGGGLASADARLGLAALAERQGRGRDALAHYLAAIRMRPDDARAHARLGRFYAARGSHHLAINEYRLAIRLAPQDPRPAYSLSVLYARLGRPEYALRYLKEAIARDAGMRERARRESAFAPLRWEPAFQSLTEPGRGGGEP